MTQVTEYQNPTAEVETVEHGVIFYHAWLELERTRLGEGYFVNKNDRGQICLMRPGSKLKQKSYISSRVAGMGDVR